MLDVCPRRGCDAVIDLHPRFECSKCGYTYTELVEDANQAALAQADIHLHEQMADSPAFNWDDFDIRR